MPNPPPTAQAMAEAATPEELLPCPFCGGEGQPALIQGGGVEWAQVECVEQDCGGVGPTPATEAQAIAAWNRRAAARSGWPAATDGLDKRTPSDRPATGVTDMTDTPPPTAQALAEAGTPKGPWEAKIWRHSGRSDTVCVYDPDGREIIHWAGFDATPCTKAERRAMVRFIAAARTGWPATLDELERCKAALERLREAAGNYVNDWLLDEMNNPALCWGSNHHEQIVELFDAIEGAALGGASS